MNQDELRDFFEKWQVPFMETGAGLAMQSWGNMPNHLREKMKHEQRTHGKNRAQRRNRPQAPINDRIRRRRL